MLDGRVVRVKVTGDYACFTRPDLKVERMSYPCMTPAAARGVLDSILWKPEFQWYIRRIYILRPIRFCTIKRNELKARQGNEPIVIDAVDKRRKPKYRAQRNSVVLRDVSYVIEASVFQKQLDEKNRPEKYIGRRGIDGKRDGIFIRRLKKGQCWRRPFLGTREFAAEFAPVEEEFQPIRETIPVGNMLFDLFYDDKGKVEPVFFHDVAIRDGVLDCEVPENDRIMQSSHLRPPADKEISSLTYEFNLNEEKEALL